MIEQIIRLERENKVLNGGVIKIIQDSIREKENEIDFLSKN